MPQTCSVRFCNTTSDYEYIEKGIFNYPFPKDSTLLEKWIKALQFDAEEDLNLNSAAFVCSLHFKPEELKGKGSDDDSNFEQELSPMAVPSMNLPAKPASKDALSVALYSTFGDGTSRPSPQVTVPIDKPIGHSLSSEGIIYYEILKGLHQYKGDSRLYDSLGFYYDYNVKSKTWKCAVPNKDILCEVSLCQQNDIFIRNNELHVHSPKLDQYLTDKFRIEIKEQTDDTRPFAIIYQEFLSRYKLDGTSLCAPRLINVRKFFNNKMKKKLKVKSEIPIDDLELDEAQSDKEIDEEMDIPLPSVGLIKEPSEEAAEASSYLVSFLNKEPKNHIQISDSEDSVILIEDDVDDKKEVEGSDKISGSSNFNFKDDQEVKNNLDDIDKISDKITSGANINDKTNEIVDEIDLNCLSEFLQLDSSLRESSKDLTEVDCSDMSLISNHSRLTERNLCPSENLDPKNQDAEAISLEIDTCEQINHDSFGDSFELDNLADRIEDNDEHSDKEQLQDCSEKDKELSSDITKNVENCSSIVEKSFEQNLRFDSEFTNSYSDGLSSAKVDLLDKMHSENDNTVDTSIFEEQENGSSIVSNEETNKSIKRAFIDPDSLKENYLSKQNEDPDSSDKVYKETSNDVNKTTSTVDECSTANCKGDVPICSSNLGKDPAISFIHNKYADLPIDEDTPVSFPSLPLVNEEMNSFESESCVKILDDNNSDDIFQCNKILLEALKPTFNEGFADNFTESSNQENEIKSSEDSRLQQEEIILNSPENNTTKFSEELTMEDKHNEKVENKNVGNETAKKDIISNQDITSTSKKNQVEEVAKEIQILGEKKQMIKKFPEEIKIVTGKKTDRENIVGNVNKESEIETVKTKIGEEVLDNPKIMTEKKIISEKIPDETKTVTENKVITKVPNEAEIFSKNTTIIDKVSDETKTVTDKKNMIKNVDDEIKIVTGKETLTEEFPNETKIVADKKTEKVSGEKIIVAGGKNKIDKGLQGIKIVTKRVSLSQGNSSSTNGKSNTFSKSEENQMPDLPCHVTATGDEKSEGDSKLEEIIISPNTTNVDTEKENSRFTNDLAQSRYSFGSNQSERPLGSSLENVNLASQTSSKSLLNDSKSKKKPSINRSFNIQNRNSDSPSKREASISFGELMKEKETESSNEIENYASVDHFKAVSENKAIDDDCQVISTNKCPSDINKTISSMKLKKNKEIEFENVITSGQEANSSAVSQSEANDNDCQVVGSKKFDHSSDIKNSISSLDLIKEKDNKSISEIENDIPISAVANSSPVPENKANDNECHVINPEKHALDVPFSLSKLTEKISSLPFKQSDQIENFDAGDPPLFENIAVHDKEEIAPIEDFSKVGKLKIVSIETLTSNSPFIPPKDTADNTTHDHLTQGNHHEQNLNLEYNLPILNPDTPSIQSPNEHLNDLFPVQGNSNPPKDGDSLPFLQTALKRKIDESSDDLKLSKRRNCSNENSDCIPYMQDKSIKSGKSSKILSSSSSIKKSDHFVKINIDGLCPSICSSTSFRETAMNLRNNGARLSGKSSFHLNTGKTKGTVAETKKTKTDKLICKGEIYGIDGISIKEELWVDQEEITPLSKKEGSTVNLEQVQQIDSMSDVRHDNVDEDDVDGSDVYIDVDYCEDVNAKDDAHSHSGRDYSHATHLNSTDKNLKRNLRENLLAFKKRRKKTQKLGVNRKKARQYLYDVIELPDYLQKIASLNPSLPLIRDRTTPQGCRIKVRTIPFVEKILDWAFKETFLSSHENAKELKMKMNLGKSRYIYADSTTEDQYPLDLGEVFPFTIPGSSNSSPNVDTLPLPFALEHLSKLCPSIVACKTKEVKNQRVSYNAILLADQPLEWAFKETLLSSFDDAPILTDLLGFSKNTKSKIWPEMAAEIFNHVEIDHTYPFSCPNIKMRKHSSSVILFGNLSPHIAENLLEDGASLPQLPPSIFRRFEDSRCCLIRLLSIASYYYYVSEFPPESSDISSNVVHSSILASFRPMIVSQANELAELIFDIRKMLLDGFMCRDKEVIPSLIYGCINFSRSFFSNIHMLERAVAVSENNVLCYKK